MLASLGSHTMLANILFGGKYLFWKIFTHKFGLPGPLPTPFELKTKLPTPIFTPDAATLTLHARNWLKRPSASKYLFRNAPTFPKKSNLANLGGICWTSFCHYTVGANFLDLFSPFLIHLDAYLHRTARPATSVAGCAHDSARPSLVPCSICCAAARLLAHMGFRGEEYGVLGNGALGNWWN